MTYKHIVCIFSGQGSGLQAVIWPLMSVAQRVRDTVTQLY
jgi:hypothetical protein